jgi:uncharacterized heparinase superfamily protein
VIHERSFCLELENLTVNDQLTGKFKTAEANFLLHPDVEVREKDNSVALNRNGREANMQFDGGQLGVHPATWHPEFGLSIPTHRITVTFTGSALATTIRWGN